MNDGLQETSIRGVMMPNGAVFVAKCTIEGDRLRAESAIGFQVVPSQDGQTAEIAPRPLMIFSEEEGNYDFPTSQCTFFTPRADLLEVYQEMTRTIMVPPTAKLLVS